LIHVLRHYKQNYQQQQQQEEERNVKSDNTMTTKNHHNIIHITSVFVSMDIFHNWNIYNKNNDTKGLKNINRRREDRNHHHHIKMDATQQGLIYTLLQTMQESLVELQSIQLYNSPTATTTFTGNYDDDNHTITTTTTATDWNQDDTRDDENDDDGDGDDDDVDVDDGDEDTTVNDHVIGNHDHNDNDDDGGGNDRTTPIMITGPMLAILLQSLSLQSITITRCLFLHTIHDIQIVSQSLLNHPKLHTIHLLSIQASSNLLYKSNNPCFDLILNSFSTLNQLESVNITFMKPQQNDEVVATSSKIMESNTKTSLTNPNNQYSNINMISPNAIRQLITKTNVKDISLWECQLQDEHLIAISDALLYGNGQRINTFTNNNNTRKSISSSSSSSNSVLQFLSLRCNPNISYDAWCQFYIYTLPYCYSIQSIYNDHVVLNDFDYDCIHIQQPITTTGGSTHSSTTISSKSITTSTSNDNSTTREGLRFWDIYTSSDNIDSSTNNNSITGENAIANAELYLSLNNLGRGSIIHSTYANNNDDDDSDTTATKECSVRHVDECLLDLLCDVTDTPSAIYALIRNHPMMILSYGR
jgi:hypothetical protein